MYAYIDESGNSGRNLQDPNQPYFYHMALLSNDDLDKERDFQKILTQYNIQEMHGSRQKIFIESYAIDLLTILEKYDIYFFYHYTEKEVFAYIKLFEALFDPYENKSANSEIESESANLENKKKLIIYKNENLKFALLSYFIETIPPNIAFDFFKKCLLEINEDVVSKNLVEICQKIIYRLERSDINCINSYIKSTVCEVLLNTMQQSSSSGQNRKHYDLPNLFDWTNVLFRISQYAKNKKEHINKIVHDKQDKFKESMDEVYSMCLRLAESNAFLNLGNIGMVGYNGLPFDRDDFEFKESSDSYGIQTVDVCLYVFSHSEHYKSYENISQLIHFIHERCDKFGINREIIRNEGDIHQLIEFLNR